MNIMSRYYVILDRQGRRQKNFQRGRAMKWLRNSTNKPPSISSVGGLRGALDMQQEGLT